MNTDFTLGYSSGNGNNADGYPAPDPWHPANPIPFGVAGVPVLRTDPTNICVHSSSPYTVTLEGTAGLDGTALWAYGVQTGDGLTFTFTPDTAAKPGAVTATFTVDGNRAAFKGCRFTEVSTRASMTAKDGTGRRFGEIIITK